MKPVAIPDDMPIEGAEKTTISGKEAGAADVEALVAPVKVPVGDQEFDTFRFSMLLECDEVDLRSLQLDPRLWLHLYGQQIQPFMLDTAFVSLTADEKDPVTIGLRELGNWLAAAWTMHAAGKQAEARRLIIEIETIAGKLLSLAFQDGPTGPIKPHRASTRLHIGNGRTTGQDPGTASEHQPEGEQGDSTP